MATITIPDDTYQRLARQAAASGTTVEAIAVPVLEQLVGTGNGHPQPTPSATETLPQQRLAFEELTKMVQARAALYPAGFRVDDSRESIYEGCGE
ncbi:MAG: hypothetical protein ACRC8S_14500 [Fimbriiglobus sp.]